MIARLLIYSTIMLGSLESLAASDVSYLDRRYNKISHIKVHNATSTTQKTAWWFIPNLVADQNNSVDQQLADGMRAFKIPVHPVTLGNKVYPWITHVLQNREIEQYVAQGINYIPYVLRPFFAGSFENWVVSSLEKNLWQLDLTNEPVHTFLIKLKTFLDKNPHEIITIFLNVFDLNQMQKQLPEVFHTTAIDSYMLVQAIDQEWPTLRQIIASNKRLIVFSDEHISGPGFNYYDDFFYTNDYGFKTLEQLNADTAHSALTNKAWLRKVAAIENPNENNPDNTLFDLGHNITPGLASNPTVSYQAHAFNIVIDHVKRCNETLLIKGNSIIPNFISVDFYDQNMNDLKRAVTQLNA